MRAFRPGLSLKLSLLVVLAVAVTAAAASATAILIGRAVLRTAALDENLDRVDAYARAVRVYVDQARSVLEATAGFSSVASLNLDRRVIARVLASAPIFEYLALLRADGTVLNIEPAALEQRLSHRALSFHAWYRQVVESRRTVVSDLHISPATQRPTIVIATPIMSPAGAVIGIWSGALKLEELSRLGRVRGSTEISSYGHVTDRRGLIIAHQARPSYVENQTDFSAVPIVGAALAGHRGTLEYVNPIEGESKLGAYRPVEGLGWTAVYVVPTRTAFAPVSEMARGIVLASTGLAILMGASGLLVARRIAGPLKTLTTAARTIGAGHFGAHLDVRSGDEIGQLAEEFNRMGAALAEKDAQLRLRATELEAANRELEAFSYSVSHDLRAPLRAMDGFSRILLEEEAPALSAHGTRYLGLVRENAVQMGRLVDDLLTFSRLSRQDLKRVTVAFEELIKRGLDDLAPEQADRRIDFIIGELPVCEVDPSLMRQVWLNLLSNALKFTRRRDPARIEVGAREQNGECVYFVKDNGVGFDPRYAGKLFGVFQRLHRAEEYEGTGVGLAIVQRIVHRHGGRVWAEGGIEQGATFFFTLTPAPAVGRTETP